ncbi:MAG: LacI family DNA-binding transcriptional regulator, partial [Bacteroidales bacterium]|nr:LacI family DNA-binding transcriptional regulator [Bacteroidales bacterium]
RPMRLKDIAEKVGLDLSTVSRVLNNKYIQTHFGTFPVKKLFSQSLENEEGEEISTAQIKAALSELIENEDKTNPLSDETLVTALKEKGFSVARRTVAKYREHLGYAVARLRKRI